MFFIHFNFVSFYIVLNEKKGIQNALKGCLGPDFVNEGKGIQNALSGCLGPDFLQAVLLHEL